MKNLFLLLTFLLISTTFYAQNNWTVSFSHRHQPTLNNSNSPLITSGNLVLQHGLTIFKKWKIGDKVAIQNGLGFSREHIWGRLSVNHCWSPTYTSQTPCTEQYVGTKHYTIYNLETPIRISYQYNDDLSFGLNNIPQFRFFQSATNTLESIFLFDIHGIEVYPELTYHFNQYSFSLGYRIVNLRKPDTIFYYDYDFLDNNPDFFQKQLHSNNPKKLAFRFGYNF
ncbi:MAG: hypothetical protein AB8G11_05340 [Saprospiraceae bacterium]